MKVAIIGSGGIALGLAALLDQRGHSSVLLSPRGQGLTALEGEELVATGAVEHRFNPDVARDLEAAVGAADAVILAMRINGHRVLLERLAPMLRPGQMVVISAELSFGGVYLAQRLGGRAAEIPIASLSTTVLFARRSGDTSVQIGGVRSLVDFASLGPDPAQTGSFLNTLFGERFRRIASPLAIALSNLNPPAHAANVLCNFTRVEKGESWSNYGGITPGVARLIEALDAERLALAAVAGIEVRSVQEHYRNSFGFAPGLSLAEMSEALHNRREGKPLGPTDIDTRFITEDLPFGIATLEHLGRKLGQEVRLHSAALDLVGAIYARDFRVENDLLPHTDLVAAGLIRENLGGA